MPGSSVLQSKTGQYNTAQHNTLQYNTIKHITQNNRQHSWQTSIRRITNKKESRTHTLLILTFRNLAHRLLHVSVLLFFQPLNWTVMHLELHYCPHSVSWGPQAAQYSNCPMRDFRPMPRSSWELRSAGLLRSWYSLRNNPAERSSHLYCPLETDFQTMAAPVSNMDRNIRERQVLLSHFKPVYTGLWSFQT